MLLGYLGRSWVFLGLLGALLRLLRGALGALGVLLGILRVLLGALGRWFPAWAGTEIYACRLLMVLWGGDFRPGRVSWDLLGCSWGTL